MLHLVPFDEENNIIISDETQPLLYIIVVATPNSLSSSISFISEIYSSSLPMVGAILHINASSTLRFSCKSTLEHSTLPPKPNTIKITPTQSYWPSLQADIEAHLKQAILIKEPLTVFEPMHHLVFAAPKTTVPALCAVACEVVGGHKDQAMAAASTLLLLRAAIYTHEHLPLTDRLRPGPMIHHVYGPDRELLIGDGIIPFGFEMLARSDDSTGNNSERILRAIIEISHAVGSKGVIDGQYRKVLLTQSDGKESSQVESIKQVVEKTEGEWHACGAACGAVLGGGSQEEIEKLRKYGLYVGMIQGILHECEEIGDEKGLLNFVKELKNLALKELEGFKGKKVEEISSFLEI